MNDKQATVDTFFGFSEALESDSKTSATLKAGLPVTQVKEAVKQSGKKRFVPIAASALMAAIAGLLNISLWEIIERAWNEGVLLKKYRDPEKYDPDESITLVLKKHNVKSQHSPKIDVVLNGEEITKIDFDLSLSLNLKGVILNIQGGHIRSIEAGTIKGSAKLKCENMLLFSRDTKTIDLPGVLNLPKRDADEQ